MIHKKRIFNTEKYLIDIDQNEEFFIGCEVDKIDHRVLERVGFNVPVSEGNQILPSILGPVSEYNSEGTIIKEKDKPKETISRDIIIKDWHGNPTYVDIPYKRYQRIFLNPPSIELKIAHKNNNYLILSPQLIRTEDNNELIKHIFNLFLELFEACYVLKKDILPSLGRIPTKRVNWEILPKGEYPWEKIKSLVDEYTKGLNNSRKILIQKRFEVLTKYKSSNLIIGKGGFNGYWILEFEEKNIYVLESLYYGHATYVLGNDWESISQLTKREILQRGLHEYRIIHGKNWEVEIERLLV